MKTSEAFQIWTKCVENKCEGNRVPPGERKLECTLTKEPQNNISHFVFVCLFFVFVTLRPKSTAMVIAGRSVYLSDFFLGRLEQAVNQ